jgi:hypothetical protein
LLEVSSRKQAADITLMMELGAHLDRHIHERERVIIVSRDELLISAAEYAQSRGCTVFIAYADSEIPTARSTRLTTLLLPAIAKPSPPHRPPRIRRRRRHRQDRKHPLPERLRFLPCSRSFGRCARRNRAEGTWRVRSARRFSSSGITPRPLGRNSLLPYQGLSHVEPVPKKLGCSD